MVAFHLAFNTGHQLLDDFVFASGNLGKIKADVVGKDAVLVTVQSVVKGLGTV